MSRLLATIACVSAIGFGSADARAQSSTAITLSQEEWTVLTMAPDGSWGTATDLFINRAVAEAIRMCRDMSGKQLGCGAMLVSVQAGWSLGLRCGDENILAADRYLETAEGIARERELELRYDYEKRDMAPCRRVVTVNPEGRVIAPQIALPDARVSAGDSGR